MIYNYFYRYSCIKRRKNTTERKGFANHLFFFSYVPCFSFKEGKLWNERERGGWKRGEKRLLFNLVDLSKYSFKITYDAITRQRVSDDFLYARVLLCSGNLIASTAFTFFFPLILGGTYWDNVVKYERDFLLIDFFFPFPSVIKLMILRRGGGRRRRVKPLFILFYSFFFPKKSYCQFNVN